jgi:hypothetical protein
VYKLPTDTPCTYGVGHFPKTKVSTRRTCTTVISLASSTWYVDTGLGWEFGTWELEFGRSWLLKPSTLFILYPLFKTEYSCLVSKIPTFISTFAFIIIYFSPSSKLPYAGPTGNSPLFFSLPKSPTPAHRGLRGFFDGPAPASLAAPDPDPGDLTPSSGADPLPLALTRQAGKAVPRVELLPTRRRHGWPEVGLTAEHHAVALDPYLEHPFFFLVAIGAAARHLSCQHSGSPHAMTTSCSLPRWSSLVSQIAAPALELIPASRREASPHQR